MKKRRQKSQKQKLRSWFQKNSTGRLNYSARNS